MKHIQLKDTKIRVDTFDCQTSPTGRQFKNIGLSKREIKPREWSNNLNKWIYFYHWYYRFKYDTGEYFTIEVDYNNKFVQLIKNE